MVAKNDYLYLIVIEEWLIDDDDDDDDVILLWWVLCCKFANGDTCNGNITAMSSTKRYLLSLMVMKEHNMAVFSSKD
jgi:hypothetical protein